MAPPAPPPVPSSCDKDGPVFVKSDIEHATKKKSDGSPTVSIKELPVGSRLRIDGPGPTDQSVYFARAAGRPDQPVVWECSFQKKHESTAADGSVVVTYGEKSSHVVCGNNCSCNFQSLFNHARVHWGSSAAQKLAASSAKKKRKSTTPKQATRAVKKMKPDGMDSSGEPRTLDDHKQGERFYRELCEAKDEEIRSLKEAVEGNTAALKKEVEEKTVVIDRLRAELVRGLESVAVHNKPAEPDSALLGGETEAGAAASAKNATAKDGKPRGRKRGSPSAPHVDSEKQRQYRAKLEENWNAKLQLLKDYQEQHAHCNVPLRWKGNPTLGAWLNKQRENYRAVLRGDAGPGGAPKISDARIAALDALGLCWNVRETRDGAEAELLAEKAWNGNLRALAAYREERGDCLVPKSYNAHLASFVYGVRRAFKLQREYRAKAAAAAAEGAEGAAVATTASGKPAKGMPFEQWLTQPRIDQLNELGFAWSMRASPAEIWIERYEKLRVFREQFGHCRVPAKYDKVLNQWILSMRHYYKNTMNEDKAGDKKAGKLSAEKIFQLQRLGFEWEVLEEARGQAWETRFRDMIRYRAEHGHCRVPKQYPQDTKLSHWVYEQRKNHKSLRIGSKRGRRGLTDERIRRLEEIGFEWSVLPAKTEVEPELDEGEAAAEAVARGYDHSEAAMEAVARGYEHVEAAAVARGYEHPDAVAVARGYEPLEAAAGVRGYDHAEAAATAARGYDHAARGYDHSWMP